MGALQAAACAGTSGGIGLSASASPSSVSGSGVNGTIFSNSSTASATGGIGSYTYLWSKVSGATINISSPTSATTTFSGNPLIGATISAIFKCTVTSGSKTAETNSVTVELERIDPG